MKAVDGDGVGDIKSVDHGFGTSGAGVDPSAHALVGTQYTETFQVGVVAYDDDSVVTGTVTGEVAGTDGNDTALSGGIVTIDLSA